MPEVHDFDEEFELLARPRIAFKLCGQEFETPGFIHPAVLLNRAEGTEGTVQFFLRILAPESRERFQALIDDPDTLIDIAQLDYIGGWLIREVSGMRPTEPPPTEPPASSGNGSVPSEIGSGSRASSSKKAASTGES